MDSLIFPDFDGDGQPPAGENLCALIWAEVFRRTASSVPRCVGWLLKEEHDDIATDLGYAFVSDVRGSRFVLRGLESAEVEINRKFAAALRYRGIDVLRLRARKKTVPIELVDVEGKVFASEDPVGAAMVAAFLESLSADDLHLYDRLATGFSQIEIAEDAECSAKTIQRRVTQLRQLASEFFGLAVGGEETDAANTVS